MDRLSVRSRLSPNRKSPIPASAFPTVLEEPTADDDKFSPDGGGGGSGSPGGDMRKHRRRLPLLSTALTKNRSSRSFDSGISHLLSSSDLRNGSPSPPDDVSTNRQSTYSPCASPAQHPPPRSPLRPPPLHAHQLPPPFSRSLSSNLTIKSANQPPISPTFKAQKPGLFGSRRYSENGTSQDSSGVFNFSRTLSPISYPNSTKSSPVMRASPALAGTTSHDSDSSPPSPPVSPGVHGSSSPLRASRRMLPETPKSTQMSRDFATTRIGLLSTSPRSSYCTTGSHNYQQSPTVTTSATTSVWQSISSRDSLDSGVYSSRSTTCDSSISGGSNNANSRTLTSPIISTTARESSPSSPRTWRRGARLPETPAIQGGDWETTYASIMSTERLKSLPSQDSSEDSDYLRDYHSSRRVHFDSLPTTTTMASSSHCDISSSSTTSNLGSVGRSASSSNSYMVNNRYTFTYKGRRSVTLQDETSTYRSDYEDSIINGHGYQSPKTEALDVPKLKELKSHSFPPPWGGENPITTAVPPPTNAVTNTMNFTFLDDDDDALLSIDLQANQRRQQWLNYR